VLSPRRAAAWAAATDARAASMRRSGAVVL
jgi:hypothetical protein